LYKIAKKYGTLVKIFLDEGRKKEQKNNSAQKKVGTPFLAAVKLKGIAFIY